MGSSSSMSCRGRESDIETSVGDPNPLEEFNKKERGLLRDTWTQIEEPKEVVGKILIDILELQPEMKPVFGVKLVPKATMLKMPIAGGHVKQFVDLFDSLTNTLGFLDNALGAQQILRRVGRSHAKVPFLQSLAPTATDEDTMTPLRYLEVFSQRSLKHLLPLLMEDQSQKPKKDDDEENRKVRFAQSYPSAQVTDVWYRFMSICVHQIHTAFTGEVRKHQNELSLKALAPQQRIEEAGRREKTVKSNQEKRAANNTKDENEKPKDEELYEDPF